eukprot:CAMPEP_0197854292 /NCGR_PEP_ID=MMETSP1438-20131217/24392_1 /TAXON_ID=1461541 /ORGANISM="Pterosperma sp., Strain CCMP1384" /LENGTH=66 /DNA_ID=CAMNT_0043468979 /DNA_START=542 /DNA_END=742 /DNA_ORIENTATION=-
MAKPIAVLKEIFVNSLRSGLVHFFTSLMLSLANSLMGFTTTFATSILKDFVLAVVEVEVNEEAFLV